MKPLSLSLVTLSVATLFLQSALSKPSTDAQLKVRPSDKSSALIQSSASESGLQKMINSNNKKNDLSSPAKIERSLKKEIDGNSDRGGGDAAVMIQSNEQLNYAIDKARKDAEYEKAKIQADLVREKYTQSLNQRVTDGSLKADILKLVQDPAFIASLQNSDKKLMQELLDKDLVDDIKASNYYLSDNCVDLKGVKKTLSTKIGSVRQPVIGAEICVDMAEFVKTYAKGIGIASEQKSFGKTRYSYHPYPVWILFGLFMHDHARHYGVMDEDHMLAARLSQSVFEFEKFVDIQDESTTIVRSKTVRTRSLSPEKIAMEFILNPQSPCVSEGGNLDLGGYTNQIAPNTYINKQYMNFISLDCKKLGSGMLSMGGSQVRIFDISTNKTIVRYKVSDSSGYFFVRFQDAYLENNGVYNGTVEIPEFD